jgi:hypothetical protein
MQANPDVTWTQASAAVWSCLELNLGILCNCLALLKPFVRRHMSFLGVGSSGSAGPTSGRPEANDQDSFTKHSNKPWDRMGGGKHSYQLHSVGKPSDEPVDARPGKKGIVVVDEYDVDVVYKPRKDDQSGDGGSTDSILGLAQSGHRAL